MEATYVQKTKPFDHQRTDYDRYRDHPSRARWWEQGTGKTKPTIDEIGYAYACGHIDAVLVVAPKGVDYNWVNDELVTHLGMPFIAHVWRTGGAKTNKHREQVRTILYHKDRAVLPVMVIGYDACKTEEAEKAMLAFLKVKRVAMVLDEATRIKNPNSFTTKRILRFGRRAVMRRLLNGTPVADSPFHAYTQCKFLDEDIWKPHGISTMAAMKTTFGVWENRRSKEGREYPALLRHKNLNLLHQVVGGVGTRYLKDEVLDLPPKLYRKHYYDLTPAQRKMYNALEQDYMAWFGDGSMVSAELAIVRQTRMQQICSGYLPADDEDELREIDTKRNPRLDAMQDLLEDVPGQVIIWAKYDIDIDLINRTLRARGETTTTVDGRTSDKDREDGKHGFQAGDYRYFIAKPNGPAGRGLTLHAAKTVLYYNNGYSLDDRLQSEDRPHRIGQTSPVLYIDLCGRGTVDEHIREIHRKKVKISSHVMGDKLPKWV